MTTRSDFDDILHDLVVRHATIDGFDVDFIVTKAFELEWAGFNDDMEPGIYLHYEFYVNGKDHKYQGYMPIDLKTIRDVLDE